MVELTRGAIVKSHEGNGSEPGNLSPTVQVLQIKKISGENNPSDRFRLIISDGDYYQQAMLTTQLNGLVAGNKLTENCIIELKEFICSTVASRKIVIILQLSVVDPGPGGKIGNPVNISTRENVSMAGPTAAAPAPAQNGSATYSGNKRHYHPIASLNPYQNRWTIKARVTSKGDTRTWNNDRGGGKLFSIDLLDADGGQIRATMFNDAHDKFYPLFQQDKVYSISKGQLKMANKKFNRLPNDYELTLNSDAEVEMLEEDKSIETQKFAFIKIEALTHTQEEEHVDLIGVVTNVDETKTVMSKNKSKELTKRTITITDDGAVAVDCTLWGDTANKYGPEEVPVGSIMAIKTCRVSNFGGKSVSATFGSQIFINPDRSEAHQLKQWYDTVGKSQDANNLSRDRTGGGGRPTIRKTFSEAAEQVQAAQIGGDAEYFSIRCTVTFFKHDKEKPPWYPACPSDGCNKKVTSDEDRSTWVCEKCGTFPNMQPRYILSLLCCDSTGSQWLTAFNEAAETLLSKSAKELSEYLEQGNNEAYDTSFVSKQFNSYVLRCRVKTEMYQDSARPRYTIMRADPLNYKEESKMLLEQIAAYN